MKSDDEETGGFRPGASFPRFGRPDAAEADQSDGRQRGLRLLFCRSAEDESAEDIAPSGLPPPRTCCASCAPRSPQVRKCGATGRASWVFAVLRDYPKL